MTGSRGVGREVVSLNPSEGYASFPSPGHCRRSLLSPNREDVERALACAERPMGGSARAGTEGLRTEQSVPLPQTWAATRVESTHVIVTAITRIHTRRVPVVSFTTRSPWVWWYRVIGRELALVTQRSWVRFPAGVLQSCLTSIASVNMPDCVTGLCVTCVIECAECVRCKHNIMGSGGRWDKQRRWKKSMSWRRMGALLMLLRLLMTGLSHFSKQMKCTFPKRRGASDLNSVKHEATRSARRGRAWPLLLFNLPF